MVGHIVQKYNTVNPDNRTGSNLALGVYEAVVRDNRDALLAGRLAVYIPELGGNVDDQRNWLIVRYASPFYGISPYIEPQIRPTETVAQAQDQGSISPSDFAALQQQGFLANATDNLPNSQQPGQQQGQQPGGQQQGQQGQQQGQQPPIVSYGMWAVPPDVGVTVLVMFAGGDLNRGFWFACVPTLAHGMVPAIGAPDGKTPMSEFNPLDSKTINSADLKSVERQPYQPLVSQLTTQGIAQDPMRGPITSSSFRESPSKVFGISSQGGHNFVMDDGSEDGKSKLIRLRTAGGNQITMHDDTGMIYMINAQGTGWIEISPSGQIDVFGAAGINLASPGDINIHGNKNVSIHAGECVKIVGMKGTKVMGGEELQLHGKKTMIEGVDELHVHSCKEIRITSFGDVHMKAYKYCCVKGKCFFWNSCPTKEAEQVPPEQPQTVSGYQTTVKRAPNHEPYKEHDGGAGGAPGAGGGMTGNGSNQTTSPTSGNGQPFQFNGTQQQAFDTVYQAAVKAGSPDPKMTASIAMLESGWLGSSMTNRANNPFGQTIKASQIGTNGIVGGTTGADGQLHAVYESIDAAVADHVRRWGSTYVPDNPGQTTSNLVGKGYNTVNPAWSGSINNIYASSNNTNNPVTVNTPTLNTTPTTSTNGTTTQPNNNVSGITSTTLGNTSTGNNNQAIINNADYVTGNTTTTNTTINPSVFDSGNPADQAFTGQNTSLLPNQNTAVQSPDVFTSGNPADQVLTGQNPMTGSDIFTSGNPADQAATGQTPAQQAGSAAQQIAGLAAASDIPAAPGGGNTGCFAQGDNCQAPGGGGGSSKGDNPSGKGDQGLSNEKGPEGQLSQKEMYDLMIAQGASPEEARKLSAIAMAESGGNIGAWNQTAPDNSYGLWQVNMYGNLEAERLQQFGLSNNSQLWNPSTNAAAAWQIYKQQGYNAWSTYSNGAYLKYY